MRWLAPLLCLAGLLCGCQVRLTPEGLGYVYSYAHGDVTISASRQTGGNERELFWSPRTTASTTSTACAEWLSGKGLTQDGFAFGIRAVQHGLTAFTVTRNVYGRAFWLINFHHWNTRRAVPYQMIHQTSLLDYLTSVPEFPLWACARAEGRLLQFIVWQNGKPRPAWGSSTQGAEVRVPPRFGSTLGVTGFYIGHVEPGTSAEIGSLSIDGKQLGSGVLGAVP